MRVSGMLVVAAALVATGCSSNGDGEGGSGPAYEVVDRQGTDNETSLTVAVDTTDGLEDVFNQVVEDEVDDEGGWFVTIVCGGDAPDDGSANLLVGRHAMGSAGAAVTGLEDGDSEFELVEDQSCP